MTEQHCERCASYYMCECDDCKEKEGNEENYPMAGLAYEDPAKWEHVVPIDESKSNTQKQCSAMYASGTSQCQRSSQTGSMYCHNHQNWIIKESIETVLRDMQREVANLATGQFVVLLEEVRNEIIKSKQRETQEWRVTQQRCLMLNVDCVRRRYQLSVHRNGYSATSNVAISGERLC